MKHSNAPRIDVRHYVNNRALYIMLIPGLIYLILFRYVPLLGNVIAFQDYSVFRGLWDSNWVGLKHFVNLFTYQDFYQILRNSLLISLYDVLFGFPAPIIFALLLNEVKHSGAKRTYQSILYLPHFLSWVVIGGIFTKQLLSPDYGLFNYLITLVGGEPKYFLIDPAWTKPIIVSAGMWRDTGWGTIIYLAAIAGIDPSLYESAFIDGAGRVRQIISITLPLILPVIITLLLLKVGRFLDFGFERVYVFLNGLNLESGDIFDTYIYRVGLLNGQFSYTTAIGIFKAVVGFSLLMVMNTISKKTTSNSLF